LITSGHGYERFDPLALLSNGISPFCPVSQNQCELARPSTLVGFALASQIRMVNAIGHGVRIDI
jgi:hypothetical protein